MFFEAFQVNHTINTIGVVCRFFSNNGHLTRNPRPTSFVGFYLSSGGAVASFLPRSDCTNFDPHTKWGSIRIATENWCGTLLVV